MAVTLFPHAAPGPAATALPAQADITDFDPAGELAIGLDQPRRLQQRVLDETGCAAAHPGLRKLRAEKLETSQVDALRDRFNFTAV